MKGMLNAKGLVFGLVLILMAGQLFAQSVIAVKWDIPFEFVVGETVFPSGEYITKPAWAGNNNHAMLLTQRKTGKSVFIFFSGAVGTRTDNTSRLVFTQDGEGYVLSQIQHSHTIREVAMNSAKSRELMANKLHPAKQVIIKAS